MRVHGLRCSKVSTSYSALIPSRSGVLTLRSAGLYRYQHVEVDSSLFVSEISDVNAESSVITPSFHFYFHFLFIVNWLRLRRSPAEILHKVCTCANPGANACLFDIHWLASWFKTEIFQHCDVTNCPPPYENIPNRDTTVSYRTEPWILWTLHP